MKQALKEIKSLIPLLVLVFAFRSMAYEPFHIPSGSMTPTLEVGDFVLVEKYSYGFKLPFTEYLDRPVYLSSPSLPTHGDVIVFKAQRGPNINLIKRVIATAGDFIEIRSGKVFLNDKEVNTSKGEMSGNGSVVVETTSGQKSHKIRFTQSPFLRDFPKTRVPHGKVFVMGDNRDNSSDSRVWGFVPMEDVKGKAKLVWMNFSYPWEKAKQIFRPDRIGTMI